MLVNIITPLIWCFAILVLVTFVQCTDHLTQNETSKTFEASISANKSLLGNVQATHDNEYLPYGGTATELLETSGGFLAGENTPVWIANRNSWQEPVSYRKLEKGVVKRALDAWKALNTSGRGLGSNDGYTNSTRSTGSTDTKVLYPSVLAMLDYDDIFPADQASQDVWINEKILYALAFWNAVDLQLRYINNPSVRIRLAGIILGQNRISTPYMYENEVNLQSDSERIVVSMMEYWKHMAEINPDFNTSAYDTIATMTMSYPIFDKIRKRAPGAADTRTPCLGSNKGINGIIFHDDLSFEGIQVAVHLMARTLGAQVNGPCPLLEGDVMKTAVIRFRERSYGRTWSRCTLEEISTNLLKNGSCMEEPKEYHKPGKHVENLLPGKLFSVQTQCKMVLEGNVTDCFEYMEKDPCGELMCSSDTLVPPVCRKMGQLVPDGSWCDVGFSGYGQKICLDGRCIAEPTLA